MSSRETNQSGRPNEGQAPSSIRQPQGQATNMNQQQQPNRSMTGQQGTSTSTSEGGAPWDTPTAWGGGQNLHEKVCIIHHICDKRVEERIIITLNEIFDRCS